MRFKGDDAEKPPANLRYWTLIHFDSAERISHIAVGGDHLFTWYQVDRSGKKTYDPRGQFKSSEAAMGDAERYFSSSVIGPFVPG